MFYYLVILAIVCRAQNTKVEGKVIFQMNRDYVAEDSNLKVSLNYGQFEAYTQRNGGFTFHNIPNGRYYLEVQSRNNIYESGFIDVYQTNKGTSTSVTKVHPLTRQRPQVVGQDKSRRNLKDTMVFEVIQKIEYFEKEEEFSISSIVKNQYFFMILVTVGMLFLVKKMPMEELSNADRAPVAQQ